MDSNLQDKLLRFSADPSSEVWNKIANALDEEKKFPQRLYNYEEAPPAVAWNNIEKNLNENLEPANVVPFTKRFRKPLRYAAVACFIAVVLVTITLTVKRTEAGALEAGSNTTVPTNNAAVITEQSLEQNVSPSSSKRNEVKKTTSQSNIISSAKNNNEKEANISTANYTSENDYVFVSDGDGTLRRVSKKMAGFLRCKDDDSNCQQHLQQLRQRLAANAMTTDFTGILEMLRQLQQKP